MTIRNQYATVKQAPRKTALKKAEQLQTKRRYNVTIPHGQEFYARTMPPNKPSCRSRLRRVTFSVHLIKFADQEVTASTKDTWYNDKDYSMFLDESRRSLSIIQKAFRAYGTADSIDPVEHCIEGLDRHLSEGIQQYLLRMTSEHNRGVLDEQERGRKGQGAKF